MHMVMQRHLLSHQYGLFDGPEKIERITHNLAKEEERRFTEIAGKQITRRFELEPWVRRGIMRGWSSLYLPLSVSFEKWLITPLKSLGGHSPLTVANDNWEQFVKWRRKISHLPKEERLAFMTEEAA